MAAPAAGPARPIATPQIVERRLSNGLRVVAARSTDLPIMNAQLVLGGGAASDPDGKAGSGVHDRQPGDPGRGRTLGSRNRRHTGASGRRDWRGSRTGRNDPVRFRARRLGRGGRPVLADVVQRPDFAEAELERGRTQTINGLTVNLRQPGPLAGAVLNRIAYGGAAYGRPSSGTPECVATLTPRGRYRPSPPVVAARQRHRDHHRRHDAGGRLRLRRTRPSATGQLTARPCPSCRTGPDNPCRRASSWSICPARVRRPSRRRCARPCAPTPTGTRWRWSMPSWAAAATAVCSRRCGPSAASVLRGLFLAGRARGRRTADRDDPDQERERGRGRRPGPGGVRPSARPSRWPTQRSPTARPS